VRADAAVRLGIPKTPPTPVTEVLARDTVVVSIYRRRSN